MLIILGHLLSLVPSEVQSRELPPLLPLLFQGNVFGQSVLVSVHGSVWEQQNYNRPIIGYEIYRTPIYFIFSIGY